MGIKELLDFVNHLSALARNAPPAPLLLNALARIVTEAIVTEAKRVGPTPAYLERMQAAGFDGERARSFYNWTLDEALLRDEPKPTLELVK